MLPTSRSQPLATRVCWHFQPTSLLAKERTEGREKRDGWMVSKHEANPCQLWYLSTERGSWAAQLQVIITREKGSINLVHHLVLFFQIQRKKIVELFGLIFFYWPLQKNIIFFKTVHDVESACRYTYIINICIPYILVLLQTIPTEESQMIQQGLRGTTSHPVWPLPNAVWSLVSLLYMIER